MRILATGKTGQLVAALGQQASTSAGCTLITLGRPEFDLAHADNSREMFRALRPDVIVNTAAYTAVDQAENEVDAAMMVNAVAAGALAGIAAELKVPIIQISTDYVFNGLKNAPYVETDPVAPVNAYGRSKLTGEQAIASATANHAILRTSWVYAAQGRNFVRTMLRLAQTRAEIAVVGDQFGNPSYAPDIADVILGVARNLLAVPDAAALRGVFHVTGSGETSWAGFAEAIFAGSHARGGPSARVKTISTADFPTPAARPSNSRLDGSKLERAHGFQPPHWRDALARCLDRMIVDGKVTDP